MRHRGQKRTELSWHLDETALRKCPEGKLPIQFDRANGAVFDVPQRDIFPSQNDVANMLKLLQRKTQESLP